MEQQERHKRILRMLAEQGTASVMHLAEALGASLATIRRDLTLLETAQLLQRTHGRAHLGGAAAARQLSSSLFEGSVQYRVECKRAIARRAVELCADGDTVLIGGGTTTFQMVDFMAGLRMRVLTNSFAIARGLLAGSDNEVSLTGGKIYPEQGVILSPFDTQAVQYWQADHLFMGAHWLSSQGVMEADPLLIQAGRRLIPQAQHVTVLADSSKFGGNGGMLLCGLERINRVITDSGVRDSAVRMLEQAGVEVLVVDPETPTKRTSHEGTQSLASY